jgi:hypothetical protein
VKTLIFKRIKIKTTLCSYEILPLKRAWQRLLQQALLLAIQKQKRHFLRNASFL